MKRLLSIISASGLFRINVSSVAREIGMSRETLYEYLILIILTDDLEVGSGNRIPLYLMGFLY